MTMRVDEKAVFTGGASFSGAVDLPADTVDDNMLKESRHKKVYAQASGSASSDEARVVHVVHGASGTIKSFSVGCAVAPIGDSVVDVDLLKNGVSVLSAAVQLSESSTAYVVQPGTINTSAVAAGDVLEIKIDATAGTGTLPNGVFGSVEVLENV